MSNHEFDQILSSVKSLSPAQTRRLARKLESTLSGTATNRPSSAKASAGREAEETAFDVASRAGLIGCLKGSPGSPTDLSTNPKHRKGFGRD